MEIKEWLRSGNTCAVCAAGGSVVWSAIVASWLEVTSDPSGSCTSMSVLGLLLVVLTVDVRKWLEHPLSSIAVSVGEVDDGARKVWLEWESVVE